MNRRGIQAKDIPDDLFIEAVQVCCLRQAAAWHHPDAWCDRWDVTELIREWMDYDVPEKVVMAKAKFTTGGS